MPTPKQRATKRASPSSKSSKVFSLAGTPATKSSRSASRAAGKPASKPTRSGARPVRPAKPAAARAARPAAAGKPAKPAKASAAKPAAPKSMAARRADFGAPIAGFFSKQPAALRPLLEELRDLVHDAAPDARSSIKWGMPFFMIDGGMMCALGGHKAHVNLILSGPPGTYADPDNLLRGDGKTGRHLKLQPGDRVPREAVRGWLATAAEQARRKA